MDRDNKGLGASPDGDRATAVEPVPVSPLRDGIPSADLIDRLLLIAAWHKRGGPTPKEPRPGIHKALTEAVAAISQLQAVNAATEEALSKFAGEIYRQPTATADQRLADRLRDASRHCSGHEPSLSLLQMIADEAAERLSPAQAMSACGQDPKGLEAKPASAVPEGNAP
jgi:hypothetical protein